MFALIFDCESNGFARTHTKTGEPDKRSARVIELAWELVDVEKREVVSREKHLIKPDGWLIPNKPFWIQNGFSTKTSLYHGKPMREVLELFIEAYMLSDVLVAHNLVFDNKAVGDEMIRYKTMPERKLIKTKVCTMKVATDFCCIPFSNGRKGNKPPKLEELHYFLFKTGFDGAHDSGNDVAACRECFFELINRKIIVL